MDDSVSIRKATKEDLPKLVEVVNASFHKDYAAAGEFYSVQQFVDPNYETSTGPYYSQEIFVKNMIQDLETKFEGSFEVFLAENKHKDVVGFIILENNNERHWINNAMIKKEYQNKGFGKILFDAVTRDKKQLYLWVNVNNPALDFWKKLGFKEILRETLMARSLDQI